MRTFLLTVFWLAMLIGLPMWIGQNYPMPGGEATVLVVGWLISMAVAGVLGWEKGKRER
jgi:hypothetical protein